MSHAIRAEIAINAPIESVWAAWTNPEHLARWYPDRVDGELAAGHTVRLSWDCFGLDIALDVVDLEPHERLVVRGEVETGVVQTQTTCFASDGDRTVLDISVEGILTDDQREGATAAWHTNAGVLRTYVERYFGRDRVTFASLGPACVTFDRLFEQLTSADKLAGWLGTGTGIGAAGQEVDIVIAPGARLRGKVLARSEPREVAIVCDDIASVIAFKAFPLHGITRDEKLVGAWASVWHDDPAVANRLQSHLITAVDKLVAILQW